MMNITYPNSHIRLKKTDKNEFLYLFVALNNCIQGFNHCRPVIVVDGSHLRGPYNGTFVAASTMDGAGMFHCVFECIFLILMLICM
uniref:Putative ovule protein n=1 Tax=Solanum chacoense TaxID=4108 RepID=A0A0V0HS44_SOLCH